VPEGTGMIIRENPIALIKGNTMLKDYNLHNGTIIRFEK
jgi:hypothetical protein